MPSVARGLGSGGSRRIGHAFPRAEGGDADLEVGADVPSAEGEGVDAGGGGERKSGRPIWPAVEPRYPPSRFDWRTISSVTGRTRPANQGRSAWSSQMPISALSSGAQRRSTRWRIAAMVASLRKRNSRGCAPDHAATPGSGLVLRSSKRTYASSSQPFTSLVARGEPPPSAAPLRQAGQRRTGDELAQGGRGVPGRQSLEFGARDNHDGVVAMHRHALGLAGPGEAHHLGEPRLGSARGQAGWGGVPTSGFEETGLCMVVLFESVRYD